MLRAAFLVGPDIPGLGKLYINVFALVVALCLSAISSLWLLLGVFLAELFYLLVMTSSPSFRAPFDHMQRLQNYVKARDALLSELPEGAQFRFRELDRSCQRVVDAGGIKYAARFDMLLDMAIVFLRLQVNRMRLEDIVVDDIQTQLTETIQAHEKAEGIEKDTLSKTMSVLGRRHRLAQDKIRRRGEIDAELVRIEQQVALIADETTVAAGASTLAVKVDAVVWTLRDTQKLLDTNWTDMEDD